MNRTAATLLLLGTLAGCATRARSPVDALQGYADALRDNRLRDAWSMLSTAAREAMPYERFEVAAREHPEEVAYAVRVYESLQPEAPVTARLELSNGEALTLVEEGGRWRLDPSALDFYGQHTPAQALRSYVRALERGRWDVMLRLAPRAVSEALATAAANGQQTPEQRLQAEMAPEAEGVARRLRDALERGRVIEVAGERATMAYGRGGERLARLVREDGRWRVEEAE